MTTPTPEQIAAAMPEARDMLFLEGASTLHGLACKIATALATRDAEIATLRARIAELEEEKHALFDVTEKAAVAGEKMAGEIEELRAALTTAHRERDEARKLLAECAIASGIDTDGNTVENGGWVHLWRRAVDAVRQLRADYDEAPATAFIHSLPTPEKP